MGIFKTITQAFITFFISIVLMIIIALLATVGTFLWLDDYTNHGEANQIPDVCGMQFQSAVDVLKAQGLGYAILEYKHKKGAQDGEVLEQRPNAHALVKEGRKVYLVLNTIEEPKLGLPQIIDNCSLREAEFRLKGLGFVVEGIETVPGEREWVYGVRYKGKELDNGSAIPRGSRVTLVIGNGMQAVEDTVRFDSDFF